MIPTPLMKEIVTSPILWKGRIECAGGCTILHLIRTVAIMILRKASKVGVWPKADIEEVSPNVRYWGGKADIKI
jgi:hypothetical protein